VQGKETSDVTQLIIIVGVGYTASLLPLDLVVVVPCPLRSNGSK